MCLSRSRFYSLPSNRPPRKSPLLNTKKGPPLRVQTFLAVHPYVAQQKTPRLPAMQMREMPNHLCLQCPRVEEGKRRSGISLLRGGDSTL